MTKLSLINGLLALLLASALGCTKSEEKTGQAEAPAPSRAAALTIKGSDTLVLFAQQLAERFMAEHPGQTVQVTGGGSGTGIAALINGTTTIATSSRPMKDSEKKQVQERRGQPAVEHAVALDGIAVYVHKDNPVESLTLDQIRRIYEGEIRNWKEVGGADGRIVLYSRENNSGTYAFFKEEVLKDEDFAAEAQTLPGTAAVVNAVSRDPQAIGYGGIAFSAGIRAVPVRKDAEAPAVEPTLETVTSGTYPISRKLYMYTAGEPTGAVAEFLKFTLSPEGQAIASKAGYYPLPRQVDDARGE